ncbi:MAG: hypothetical protein ABSA57_10755 [Candidatus Acidiferrales bacterium]|jgi:hypothetical protein
MPYRPRELVIRARDTATLLLATIDRNELVQRFLDMYAGEFRRPGRADQPVLYREQLQTIRREAILAMVSRIESSLPTRLKVSVTMRGTKRRPTKSKKGRTGAKPKAANKPSMELGIPFLDLFREEFFVALGQALEWTDEDAEEFWRDLELYEQLGSPAARGPARQGGAAKGVASGPFVDRVGLVLDASLMDQARREAGKFHAELNSAADRVLQKVFSRHRAN